MVHVLFFHVSLFIRVEIIIIIIIPHSYGKTTKNITNFRENILLRLLSSFILFLALSYPTRKAMAGKNYHEKKSLLRN